jgi:hypothetical protein
MPSQVLDYTGRVLARGDTMTYGKPRSQQGLLNMAGYDIAPIGFEEVPFVASGAGTYTGSITVPAGAYLFDIYVLSTVLWDSATSAVMDIGDAGDPDGYFAAINLKATDLLVNEVINFSNLGGKQGAYIVAATGQKTGLYSASERVITGVITAVGAGSAGRTRMGVMFGIPNVLANAVKS